MIPVEFYANTFMISTCRIDMVMNGGPLVDLDGNFVGMNFYATKRTPFLTRSTITEFLVNFKKYRYVFTVSYGFSFCLASTFLYITNLYLDIWYAGHMEYFCVKEKLN